MGKPIKITKEHLDEARREFEEVLSSLKLADGKISFTKTFGGNDDKAIVYFTSEAWTKMVALIQEFTDEVAWHGLARRSSDPEGYVVYDILVYPQEVTGATVNTDQEKYQVWLMEHGDDVFNNIRMQGHSHVNMGVTPSGVDTTHQEKILDQLDDDMFYIFMIWNKKFDNHTKVYDLQKNVLYESGDVTVKLLDTGVGLGAFIADAKTVVVKKTYHASTPHGGYSGGYNYKYNGYSSQSRAADTPFNPITETKKEKTKTKYGGGLHRNSLCDDGYEDFFCKQSRGTKALK